MGSSLLFSPRDEALNLALPFFFVSLCVLDLFFGWGKSPTTIAAGVLVANYLFFNTFHVATTYFLMRKMPEFRNAYWDSSLRQRKMFWLRVGVGAAVVPILFLSFRGGLPWSLNIAAQAFIAFFPAYHSLRQVQGLSLSYNQIMGVRRRACFGPAFERICYQVITALFVLVYFFYWGAFADVPRPVSRGLAGVFFGVIVAVMLNSYLTHAPRDRVRKIIFDVRLLLFPLVTVSPLAMVGGTAMHGMEYLFVWRKILPRSKYRLDRGGKWTWVAMTAAMGFIGLFGYLRHLQPELFQGLSSRYAYIVWPLAFASFFLSYLHYLLDGEIYRMKNPAIRKHVGPLLVSAPSASRPIAYEVQREAAL